MSTDVTALSGVIPPMITPLTKDQEIDLEGLSRLVNHLLDGGVSGIFVLGSSGEGPWLTATKQAQLISATKELAGGRVPVLAGALETSTDRALETIIQHANAGADVAVITSPYYFGVSASEQIQHIETLVSQSPIPVMLYNIPPTTHNPIAPDTVKAVANLSNLVGIKDSAGDWENFQVLLQIRNQRPDFVVFQGAEKLAAKSVLAGANGIVPGLGNLVPHMFVQIVQHAQAGEEGAALGLQEQIDDLWTLHTYDYWLVCLKYAASLMDFGSGTTIGHDTQMSNLTHQTIRSLLEKVVGT